MSISTLYLPILESNAMERSQPEVVKTKTATKADETNGLHRKVNDSKSSTQTSKKGNLISSIFSLVSPNIISLSFRIEQQGS